MGDSQARDSQAKDGNQASGKRVSTTSPDAATTYVVHLLLPCDEGDHFLAEIMTESDARLPRVKIPLHGEEYLTIDVLERKVQEAFPYPVCFVKRTMDSGLKEDDIDTPGQKVINDMWVAHAAGELPLMKDPLQWLPSDDRILYRWQKPIQRFIDLFVCFQVRYLFKVIHSGIEILSKPWETLGFYKRLMRFTREILERKGMDMEGRARILQDGPRGRVYKCTARIRSGGGKDRGTDEKEVIFIKATIPVAREVERTMAAASVFGDIVPEILGFDARWGMLVQRDVGSIKDEVPDREALIGTVLYMQRVSLNHIEQLKSKGLRVLDAEWLDSNVESILNHVLFDDYFKWKEEARISGDGKLEAVNGLRSKVREIRGLCRQITELGLPNTIVHGDCFAHNIGSSSMAVEGKLYRIFDWNTAYIGNPLSDLDDILRSRLGGADPKVDWEAGVRQICEHWKELSGLAHEEIRKAMRCVSTFTVFVDLYELEEQHDTHKATSMDDPEDLAGHESRMYEEMEYLFEHLCRENERMQQTTKRKKYHSTTERAVNI